MTHLCTLMGIRHSPRTAHSLWTNGLAEVQNSNLGTHLHMFLHNTPKDWAFQTHMYAYAHNSQPLPELNVSPHEIVFYTQPRIPFTFDLTLTEIFLNCVFPNIALNFQNILIMTNKFIYLFYRTLSKPIPQWFLAVETAVSNFISRK